MKLSIIVPVYNVAPYIARCLDSCFNQDIPEENYEVVCVNDGSTDDSLAIVERYRLSYPNIVVVNQKNAGLSSARNAGLSSAQGDYIWFVDSDDWIEDNVLGKLLKQAYDQQLDTLCFTFQFVEENGEIKDGGYSLPSFKEVINGRDFISKCRRPSAVWCAIYRRNFLLENKIKCIEGIKFEDEDYTIRVYCSSNRISYTNVVAYNYFQRTGSIMKSPNTVKAAYDMLTVADSLYAFAQAVRPVHKDAYLTVMNHVAFAFSQALCYFKEGEIALQEYKQKPYYPIKINSLMSFKDKLKFLLINTSLRLYLRWVLKITSRWSVGLRHLRSFMNSSKINNV